MLGTIAVTGEAGSFINRSLCGSKTTGLATRRARAWLVPVPGGPRHGGSAAPGPAATPAFLPTGGDPFSLQPERVHKLSEDRNQVLWLGASAGGFNKLDLRQKPFGHLQQQLAVQPTLPNNYVNAIYKEEGANLLWIGTRNGFSSYDLVRITYHNYLSWRPSGETTRVEASSITQASDGTLWLGSRTHGLYTLVPVE